MINKDELRERGLNEVQIQNLIERLSEEMGLEDWENIPLRREDPDIVDSMDYNGF